MKKLTLLVIVSWIVILLTVTVYADSNLLTNPSFEQEGGTTPAAWGSSIWDGKQGAAELIYEKGEAHSGVRFVTIINNTKNDARFTQIVSVKKNTSYKLSCWIKTVDVGTDQGGKGANISIEGKLESSKDIKGTNGKWEYVEMFAKTGSGVDTMTVTVGIGGYAATNTGKASFDDVSVEEIDSIPEGALVAQLSDGGSDDVDHTSSAVPLSVGKPGKMVWYLVIAAIVVAAAGVATYYIKHAGIDSNKAGTENRGESQLAADNLSEAKCEEEGNTKNDGDDFGRAVISDKDDLL